MSKSKKSSKKGPQKGPKGPAQPQKFKSFPYDLTIAMIVKDEIATLRQCLESLQPLRDACKCQLIITDTGSTDGTKEIAQEFADDFLEFAWCDDFSAARNTGVKKAKGRWFLYLDADEIFEESIVEIAHFIKQQSSSTVDHGMITLRNYYGDTFDQDKFDLLSAARLVNFSKGTRLFQSPIHEKISLSQGNYADIPAFAKHYGYLGQWAEKKKGRNAEILASHADTYQDKMRNSFYLSKSATDPVSKITLALEGVEVSESIQDFQDPFAAACYGFAADGMNKLGDYDQVLKLKDRFFSHYSTDIPQALDLLHCSTHAALMNQDYPLACELIKSFLSCYQSFENKDKKSEALQGFSTTFTPEIFIASCLLLAELSMVQGSLQDANDYLLLSKADSYQLPSGEKPYQENFHRLCKCLTQASKEQKEAPQDQSEKTNISPPLHGKQTHNFDLTIAMIVKNEEKNLRRCLESLSPLRKEANCQVIITDTGSTDQTVEIAKEFADIVLGHQWNDDFSAARNTGVSLAEGRWFLFVDADQVYDQSISEIADFLKIPESHHYDHALLTLRNYQGDQLDVDQYDDQRVGLLINFGKGRRFFEMPIHERIPTSEKNFYETSVLIHHYGYLAQLEQEKRSRNHRILQKTKGDEALQFRSYFYLAKSENDSSKRLRIALEALSLAEKKGVRGDIYVASCYSFVCCALNDMKQYSKVLEFYDCYFKEFTTFIPQTLDVYHTAIYATLMLGQKDLCMARLRDYLAAYKTIQKDATMRSNAKTGFCRTFTDSDYITSCYQLAQLLLEDGQPQEAESWLLASGGGDYSLPSGATPFREDYDKLMNKVKDSTNNSNKNQKSTINSKETAPMSKASKSKKFPYELTISMIVKDEIKFLRRCLESLQPLRDSISCQLIITDTGSTDGTDLVAKEFADIYLEFDWCDDFSAARNVGLEQAEGRWLLYWDADEIAREDFIQVADFLKTPESHHFDNASIIMRSYLGDPKHFSKHHDKPSIKLLNFGQGKRFFRHRVHEIIDFTNETKVLPLIFDHYGYTDDIQPRKSRKYQELLKKDLESSPNSLRAMYQMVVAMAHSQEKLNFIEKSLSIPFQDLEQPIFLHSLYLEKVKTLHALGNIDGFHEAMDLYLHKFPNTLIELELLGLELTLCQETKNQADFLKFLEKYSILFQHLDQHPDVDHQSSARFQLVSEGNYLGFLLEGARIAQSQEDFAKAKGYLVQSQAYRHVTPLGERNFFLPYYDIAQKLKAYDLIAEQYAYSVDQKLIKDGDLLIFSLEQQLKKCTEDEKQPIYQAMGQSVLDLPTALFSYRSNNFQLETCPPAVETYLKSISDYSGLLGSYDLLFAYFTTDSDPLSLMDNLPFHLLEQFMLESLRFHSDFLLWSNIFLKKSSIQSRKEQKLWSKLGMALLAPLSHQDQENPHIPQEMFFLLFQKSVRLVNGISHILYSEQAFSPENADLLPEEALFCTMAQVVLQAKEEDLSSYISQLKALLTRFPQHHKLISVLLEQAIPKENKAADEFAEIGLKVKGMIKTLVKAGDLAQAESVFAQYKKLNPGDPDLPTLEQAIAFLRE